MRKLGLFAAVMVAALLAPGSANAIIHGQPDPGHTYVGMVFNQEGSCSGTLLTSKVFLTAGHCADFLNATNASQGWVTFREDGQSFPEDVRVKAAYTFPTFCYDDGLTFHRAREAACSAMTKTM